MTSITPYVAGPPVSAPHFYGRAALLAELADPRYTCFYVVGTRRVGKTSLLQALAAAAPAHAIPLFINMQRAVGEDNRLDAGRYGRVLADGARRQARGRLQLRGVDAAVAVPDRLEALAWAAEEAGLVLWLLLDEAELLADLPEGTLKALRAVLQENRGLRTVLAASKGLGGLNDRAREWTVSPFLFGFATRFIPPLPTDEASALIGQRDHPDGPVAVAPEVRALLLEMCGGHPYLLQAVCLRLYDAGARRLAMPTPRDFDRVLNEEGLGDVFQQDYDNLSHGERAVVRRLAEGQTGEEELLRRCGLPPEGGQSLLAALTEVGLIRRVEAGYGLGRGLLGRWLRGGTVQERTPRLSDQASAEVVAQARTGAASPVMLAQLVVRRLSDEELRTLCFELEVDYADLPGEGKAAKARELVGYLDRRGALARLIGWLQAHRPDALHAL